MSGVSASLAFARQWRLRRRWMWTVVAALLAVQVAVRGALAWAGYFYGDDFVLLVKAQQHGRLLDGLHYSGHTMPLALSVSGVFGRLLHANWPAAAGVLVAGQVVVGLAVVRAAYVIAPRCPAAVVAATAIYAVSPLTIAAAAWASSALNSLPMQSALATTCAEAIALCRSGRRRHVAIGTTATVLGLACTEKALIIGPAALALAAVYLVINPSVGESVLGGLRRGRSLWGVLAGVSVVWAVVIGATTVNPAPLPLGVRVRQTVDGLVAAFWQTLVPAWAGGPWRWVRMGPATPWAEVTAAQLLPGVIIGVGAAAIAMAAVRRAWMLWLLAVVVYPAVSLAPVYWARASPAPMALPLTDRAQADTAVLWALAVSITVAAPLRSFRPQMAAVVRRVASTFSALVCVTAVIGGAASTLRYAAVWRMDPAADYVRTLHRSISAAGAADAPTVLEQEVGPELLWGAPDLSTVLTAFYGADSPPVGRSTDTPTVITGAGQLVPATLESRRRGVMPVVEEPSAGRRRYELDGPLLLWDWVARVTVKAAAPTAVTAALAGDGQPVTFTAPTGTSTTYVLLRGQGDAIDITGAPGITIQTTAIDVGLLRPAAGARIGRTPPG